MAKLKSLCSEYLVFFIFNSRNFQYTNKIYVKQIYLTSKIASC